MIPFEQKQFIAKDGTTIFYYETPVTADTECLMIVIHGMTEHASRYRGFAEKLFRKNISLMTMDLRGHGATGQAAGIMGHFADEAGWDKMIGDIQQFTEMLQADHPGLPVILFGHSMGSIAARTCLIRFGELYQAGIICGTTIGIAPPVVSTGLAVANLEIKHGGPTRLSKMLVQLSFGSYNQKFKPTRTDFDWLSSNPAHVDTYMADPLCGFMCTAAFYRDMFNGLKETNKIDNISKMNKNMPVLLISGMDDPVGGMGKEVKTLYKKMQKAELTHVDCTLFPGKRHELVNDDEDGEVFNRILDFVEKALGN